MTRQIVIWKLIPFCFFMYFWVLRGSVIAGVLDFGPQGSWLKIHQSLFLRTVCETSGNSSCSASSKSKLLYNAFVLTNWQSLWSFLRNTRRDNFTWINMARLPLRCPENKLHFIRLLSFPWITFLPLESLSCYIASRRRLQVNSVTRAHTTIFRIQSL